MGVLSKSLEFNHGSVIDFDEIKNNREQAVAEISEGNSGLEELLNFCIDNNIRTHSSCGDRSPRICFIIDDENREKLINLFTVLDSLYCEDNKIFDMDISSSSSIDKLLLNIRILTTPKKSELYFKYITQILDSKVLYSQNDKFSLIEELVLTLRNYANFVSLGLEYVRDKYLYDCVKDMRVECNYDFNLYMTDVCDKYVKKLDVVTENVDYCFRDYVIYEYGIKDLDKMYKLVNTIYDSKKGEGLIKKIKSLF